ncbi:MAG: FHA domain-containing protein [Chloroflexi bacterium]|nr:FHA domain-containing protein [Chloroflexota bacterium]
MSLEVTLFILRVVSAGLLLAFIGGIAWLSYRDMKTMSVAIAGRSQQYGQLRVIANDAGGPEIDTLFPMLPVTSIGRATTNSIVLSDTFTSSEHVLIVRRGEQWWLEDLDSRNGTLLNDVLLAETAVITLGDVITIGETQIRVENN